MRRAIARHGVERPDLPGTGAELARHLLDEAELPGVPVELTGDGDHYDPEARAVRLTPQHYDGRSVAAAAVAAHEVSHAVQHARGEPAFARRLSLVKNLIWIERAASVIMLATPLVFMLLKSPALAILQIGAGLALLGIRIAVHAVTLPVEFDASFGKALPVLTRGRRRRSSRRAQRAHRRRLHLCRRRARRADRCRAVGEGVEVLRFQNWRVG